VTVPVAVGGEIVAVNVTDRPKVGEVSEAWRLTLELAESKVVAKNTTPIGE
jgi:hypothetical protein